MCALSVLQKECRKVWGARYTLGARYRSENTVVLQAVAEMLHPLHKQNKVTILTEITMTNNKGKHII